jgi:YesN/AraC family two-component response regulator
MSEVDLNQGKDNERPSSSFQRVLLVDDEPMVWRTLNRMLGKNWVLDTASDTVEAVRVFREHKFQIVVADYDMPGHDGIWLLKMVRQINPKVKRVLLSGHDLPGIDELIKSGVIHHFLSKPVDHKELDLVLRKPQETRL